MVNPQDNRRSTKSSNPDSGDAALVKARRATRRLATSHYENFLVASVLLPRRIRQPFYDLYAFCRTGDDLADESETPEIAGAHLADYRRRLECMVAGQVDRSAPHGDLFLALSDTVDRFGLPIDPMHDLIDAFEQDQSKTRYRDFDELYDYCRRSADPVGRLVLALGGSLNDQNGRLSDQICTGLQLANFWQDVARDFAIGRVYVPASEMTRFEVDESMLGLASTPPPVKRMLASLCDRAEQHFRDGLPLADRVPGWLSADIRLFAHGGLATLDAIRGIDFDVLAVRPKVGKVKQMSLVARALLGRLS